MTFSRLCQDLFLHANAGLSDQGLIRGARWEQRIAEYVSLRGIATSAVPGGYQLFGHVSLSSLAHQIDAALECTDAAVIGEWKAHRGLLPKNDLLRFKAATDDFYMNLAWARPNRPVMRIFCGTGSSSTALRVYAALHGIVLIEPARWPAPVLASDCHFWNRCRVIGPPDADRLRLAWLSRPLQHSLAFQRRGGYLIPKPASRAMIEATLELQDFWSDRLWEAFDSLPGSFEHLLARVPALRVAL